MSVLVVQDLKKSLGANEILAGVGLRIDYGEKVGCVGRNGEGKTTFLRLIEGEMAADGGTVQLAKRARVGYVVQRPQFGKGVTVRGYVETGLEEVHRVAAELERTGEAMAEVEGEELDRLVRRHGELTARMDFLGGWETERRIEAVLSGIGLATELWERDPATLSGGEKSRAAMARELVSVPDLLLLDEPTNHLDVTGIEWLEAYLSSIGSAVLMVSHDRRMLDGVVDTIVEIGRGKLVRYAGNYSRYVQLKEERFASALRTWEQQRDSIRKEESFIRKHMGSQRTAEAKGRRRRLQRVDRLERPYNDVRRPTIRPPEVERGGEQVLEVTGLAVGRGETTLLSGVDLRLGRGERVGVVGPNGSGKTTLLKTLAGQLPPLAGEAVRGYRASCGYYDQETGDLHEDSTPFLEIRREHTALDDQEIRDHLARFLFRGAEVDFTVGSLSGGERARLALALLVLRKPSWLALDEPTNHLDLASRTAVEEFLGAYPGAFVCVSHDRELLDRLCNRIVEVDGGRVRSFAGNYTDYRRHVLAEAEEASAEARKRAARVAKPARAPKAEQTPGTPARKRNKERARPRNPWRLEKLEKAIIALEKRREEILADMTKEEVFRDVTASRELQLELAEVERDLQEKNTEWENWT